MFQQAFDPNLDTIMPVRGERLAVASVDGVFQLFHRSSSGRIDQMSPHDWLISITFCLNMFEQCCRQWLAIGSMNLSSCERSFFKVRYHISYSITSTPSVCSPMIWSTCICTQHWLTNHTSRTRRTRSNRVNDLFYGGALKITTRILLPHSTCRQLPMSNRHSPQLLRVIDPFR